MRLTIALIVWAAAAAGAVVLSSSVAHSVHSQQVKAAQRTLAVNRPAFKPESVKPADRRSLFRGGNIARALALVRSHVGPDAGVEMIEIFPGQLELTVRRPDAELSVTAQADGAYFSSSDSNVSGSTQVFSLAQIHADVPGILIRRIAAHARVPISRVKFVNVRIDPIARLFHWYVYPTRDSLYFQADTATGPIREFDHGRPGRLIRGG